VCRAGTFAVVCLMIGTAVNEFDCDSTPLPSSDYSNSSTSYVNSFNEYSTTASSSTSGADGGASALQCRVGVAVALTFMAGIYQVSSPPLQLVLENCSRSRIEVRPTALVRYHVHTRPTLTFDLDLMT